MVGKTGGNKKSNLPEIEKLTLGREQSQNEFEKKIEEDRKEACRILSVTASDRQKTFRNRHLALATLRDVGINVTKMFEKCDVTSVSEFRNFYNQCDEKQIELIHRRSNRIPKPTPEKVYLIFEERELKMVAAMVIVNLEKAFQFGDISDNLKEAINLEWSNIETIQIKPMKNKDELVWQVMTLILDGHTTRISEETNIKMDFVLKFSHFIMKKRSEAS